jgi:HJR/Mrr/RecB family endonuclease
MEQVYLKFLRLGSLRCGFKNHSPKQAITQIHAKTCDLSTGANNVNGVVQCKLYGQSVGNSAVQEVIAAREYYQATIAIVVSNATYTNSARQLASMANVILLHHDEIAEKSIRMGIEPMQVI